jgi:uncharacterized protein
MHLFTTAALARINTLAPGAADVVRYRPNIVIDTPGCGFPENDWPGRTLRIGDDPLAPDLDATDRTWARDCGTAQPTPHGGP